MLEFTNVQDSQSANSSAAPAQNGAQFNAVTTSAPMAAAQAANDELNFDDELGELNPTKIKIIGCLGGLLLFLSHNLILLVLY